MNCDLSLCAAERPERWATQPGPDSQKSFATTKLTRMDKRSGAPRPAHRIMLSSTFTDLETHRAVLRKALRGQGLIDIAMEYDVAKPDVDVLDSSLHMV